MGFWKIALVSLLLGNNSVLSQNNRLFYDYDNNGNRISRTNNIESKDHRIMITASVDIPYLEYDVAVVRGEKRCVSKFGRSENI